MLVHTVFFYLNADAPEAVRSAYGAELQKLAAIPSLSGFYRGTPAPVPPRPVLDATYDHSITCLFANVAALQAYQEHPVHQDFLGFAKPWTRFQVYDAQGEV